MISLISFFLFIQALGVFGLCQILGGVNYLRTKIVGDDFQTLLQFIIYLIGGIVIAFGTLLTITGKNKLLLFKTFLSNFIILYILKEKLLHGLAVSIHYWIHLMLKIIYRSLHLFLNINLHLGLRFILTYTYRCSCFLLDYIFAFQNLQMLIFL